MQQLPRMTSDKDKIRPDVDVYCLDGLVGKVLTAIPKPSSKVTTHIIVAQKQPPHPKYLVPVKVISNITPQSIQLNCTKAELDQMRRFEQLIVTPLPQPTYGSRA